MDMRRKKIEYNIVLNALAEIVGWGFYPNAVSHAELDSASVHLVENEIDRFRVKHGMTLLAGLRSVLC